MSWTTLPDFRSTHTAKKVTCSAFPGWPAVFGGGRVFDRVTSSAVVSHTWSPHTTGDDHSLPWIAVFQRTFLVSDHSVGRLLASETPSPVGPRNAGQLSAGR